MANYRKIKVNEHSHVRDAIVNCLSEDFLVQRNFTRFLTAIRLGDVFVNGIKEEKRTGKKGYSLFRTVISTWTGRHGSAATVSKMLRALDRLEFIECKENMEAAVEKACMEGDSSDDSTNEDEEVEDENEDEISDQDDIPDEVEEDKVEDDEAIVEALSSLKTDDTINEGVSNVD